MARGIIGALAVADGSDAHRRRPISHGLAINALALLILVVDKHQQTGRIKTLITQ